MESSAADRKELDLSMISVDFESGLPTESNPTRLVGPEPELAVPSYVAYFLIALKWLTICSLVMAIITTMATLAKNSAASHMAFFDWLSQIWVALVCQFLIGSELAVFPAWFDENMPLLGSESSLVTIGIGCLFVGSEMLSEINKSFATKGKLGPFSAVLITAGATAIVAGALNIAASYVRLPGGVTARHVRSRAFACHHERLAARIQASRAAAAYGAGDSYELTPRRRAPNDEFDDAGIDVEAAAASSSTVAAPPPAALLAGDLRRAYSAPGRRTSMMSTSVFRPRARPTSSRYSGFPSMAGYDELVDSPYVEDFVAPVLALEGQVRSPVAIDTPAGTVVDGIRAAVKRPDGTFYAAEDQYYAFTPQVKE